MEANVGICCACMPVIYPLFRVFVGQGLMSKKQGSATLEAGKIEEPSQRLKHRFSHLDEASSMSDL